MKFWEIFHFEIAYRLRRVSTWIYFILLIACGLLSPITADPAGGSHFNAPANVALMAIQIGFIGLAITAALFGDTATRDVQSRMHPLFYAAPLRKRAYLGGRFLGALVVNMLILLAVPFGLAIGVQVSDLDPEILGPFRASAYLQPYAIFLLPNLLINAAILFGIAVLSRRTFPSYVGAIALFMGYAIAVASTMELEHPEAAALLDPSGLVAFMELVADWTSVEQNTKLLGLGGLLMWNRLFWIAVGVGVLAFTYSRFRFAYHAEGDRRSRKERPSAADAALERGVPVVVPPAPRVFGLKARARQTMAVMRRSFREILVSLDFLAIAVGMLIFVLTFGPEVLDDPRYGIPAWPLTHRVTALLSGFFIGAIVSLLIAVYAGELVWRDRDAGVSEIADAAPVPDWVPFVGKFLALGLMLMMLQAVLVAAGVLLQALQGYYNFEIGLYLQVLFGLQLADYVLFAAVAMLVHVLVNQKYLGHLAVLVFYISTVFAGRLGIEHNLLVYGSDPGWVYSDLSDFGPFLVPFLWFKLYWGAWALFFAVIANLFWVRGRENGFTRRLQLARMRFTRPIAMTAAIAVGLVLTTGGFIFYNTNVLNDYRTRSEMEMLRAEYERRYKRYENIPQPWLTGTQLHVEIYPGKREAEVRGTHRLVNRTTEAIDSVHLSMLPFSEFTPQAIEFDRPAKRVLADEELRYRIYVLEQPLLPGDSLRLVFELAFQPRGFPNSGISTSVVKSGTFFHSRSLLDIGYQRGFELPGANVRREYGLGPRDFRPPIDDLQARRIPRSSSYADWIDFEAVIGTDEDEIAVGPGSLSRTWTENGRRYFHYRADAPILNFYGFLSADYAVHETRWNDVQIQVLHHPDHNFNLDRVVRSARTSLNYYTKNFGPYPHRQLRIVEFPRYQVFARAYPAQMVYSEGSSLLARVDDEEGHIDSPLLVTAHEVAHQWWGHQVMGADVQGSQVLSETLAQYSALMVLEKVYGEEPVHRFLRTMQIEYLNDRGGNRSPEVPLLLTGDHAYLHYRKGAVVMYALKDYVGEERVNTALRRLVEKHRFDGPPYATSLDLYEELQAATPDSLQYLLKDLFATITLWDLRTKEARAKSTGTGEYRVTLDIEARKVRADSVGKDTEVPMNDLIEIGVFAAAEDGEGLGEPLYLQKHRVRSGQQTITVTVPGKPAQAGIDPYQKLINRHKEEMGGKVREVKLGG